MNKFEKINLQVEIINYTTDYVYYYEDLHDAIDSLGNMQANKPNDEIGVSYFSIEGIDVPFTEENIEFIEHHDADEIIALMAYYENCHGITRNVDLYDILDEMENRAVVTFHYGTSELDAFMNYCDEICLLCDMPEHLQYYFDYEKLLRDYKCDGMTIIELPCNESSDRKYMFVG